jgi:hypothetical protein
MADTSSVKLYDSGTTCHISPYLDQFKTLSDIPPKPIVAMHKQHFNATGIRELVIEIPNGVDTTKLQLTKVLYSPEVEYSLVSIGCPDRLRYTTTFAEGACTIHDPMENVIEQIPRSD